MQDAIAEMVGEIGGGGRPHTLSLFGRSGIGKTHLAREAHEFVHQNFRVYQGYIGDRGPITMVRDILFFSWVDLTNRLRTGTDENFWNRVLDSFFLVVDEAGGEYETPAMMSRLTQLADRRQDKWTIYTSNKTLDYYESLDERFVSRLFRNDGKVIEVKTLKDFNRRRDEARP